MGTRLTLLGGRKLTMIFIHLQAMDDDPSTRWYWLICFKSQAQG